jgi:hypothetical protein
MEELEKKQDDAEETDDIEMEKKNKKTTNLPAALIKAVMAHRTGDVHIDIMSHANSPMSDSEE